MPYNSFFFLYMYVANHVLEEALKPGSNGMPKGLFHADLKGIMIISVVQAGFIFSGNVGTGILLAKQQQQDGGVSSSWSPPCAVGLTGVGWGFLVGASVRELLVFMYDYGSLAAASSDTGLKLGGQAELTVGPFGRSAQVSVDVSGKGIGGTVAVAFSKGAFVGLSIAGSVVGCRSAANQAFYGDAVSPQDILSLGRVAIPENKVTLMNEVYDKLNKLAAGTVVEPTADDDAKKSTAKSAADAAAAAVNQATDVVQVNAAEEAAKEVP